MDLTELIRPPLPPRAPLPTGDLHLADGRWLRAQGEVSRAVVAAGGEPTMHALFWRGPKGLLVVASLDDFSAEGWGPLLHVSLSYPDHDPTWADIKAVRAAFYPPTVDVMLVLPRESNYVNLHEHAFHMNQTPEAWTTR